MEALTLLGLGGIAWGVSKLATRSTQKPQQENFQDNAVPRGPPTAPLATMPKGGSATGPNPELDLMYQVGRGQTLPSEPNPGPHGMPLAYANGRSPYNSPATPRPAPGPVPLEDATAQVQLNPANIEADPDYLAAGAANMNNPGYVISSLSGQRITTNDFTHNNMQPFFGGSVKQNMKADANTNVLDTFTGSGVNQIRKREQENMFKDAQAPFGNPYGLESATDFVQSRMNVPRNRAGERPFEPVHVGAGVGEKYGMTGKGGFQQIEVNEIMRPRTTDQIRTANNPKLTYDAVVVPGSAFVTKSSDDPGEVRKYRPDTFYIDPTGVSYGSVATGVTTFKETTRPVQVLPHTTRPETSVSYIPSASSQDFGESYVSGSYRTPMAQQYGGAGYRNADMTGYSTANPDAPEADYGRSSYENKPNERLATSDRTMGLNLAPADTGSVSIHYTDLARPTIRGETVGNIRQSGTPVGYAQGAPATTVWDPSDVARTTVKEGTINWGLLGIAAPASAPERLKTYDPADIARPTQKSQLSARSYTGPAMAASQKQMDETFAYNMRSNPIKEQIAKGRKPIAGSGNLPVFDGNINQTTKKLDTDIINDRYMGANRPVDLGPGAAEIGRVKYRLPLQLDMSAQRFTPDTVASLEANPLVQSLRMNAIKDSQRLKAAGIMN